MAKRTGIRNFINQYSIPELIYKETTLVTAVSSNYFSFALELLESIKITHLYQRFEMNLFSVDLTDAQKESLLSRFSNLKKIFDIKWELNCPPKGPAGHVGRQAKLFLDKYLPQYNYYVWLDCDAWVNNPFGVEYFLYHAIQFDFAGQHFGRSIYPFISIEDRFTTHTYFTRHKHIREVYNKHKHGSYQYFSGGFFVIKRVSKIFQKWRELMEIYLRYEDNVDDQSFLSIALAELKYDLPKLNQRMLLQFHRNRLKYLCFSKEKNAYIDPVTQSYPALMHTVKGHEYADFKHFPTIDYNVDSIESDLKSFELTMLNSPERIWDKSFIFPMTTRFYLDQS